ncbi:hypothetical protein PaG_04671 [Moesziomyces aphidis]|uniref:Uncharacterized protein n=1 Tax=Moesziomyces aphidis TaxID=84754 RepID=W3VGK1_MOEAP|nr:hypothetical protein PaG_04671 [Moesziomyces aphidis]
MNATKHMKPSAAGRGSLGIERFERLDESNESKGASLDQRHGSSQRNPKNHFRKMGARIFRQTQPRCASSSSSTSARQSASASLVCLGPLSDTTGPPRPRITSPPPPPLPPSTTSLRPRFGTLASTNAVGSFYTRSPSRLASPHLPARPLARSPALPPPPRASRRASGIFVVVAVSTITYIAATISVVVEPARIVLHTLR